MDTLRQVLRRLDSLELRIAAIERNSTVPPFPNPTYVSFHESFSPLLYTSTHPSMLSSPHLPGPSHRIPPPSALTPDYNQFPPSGPTLAYNQPLPSHRHMPKLPHSPTRHVLKPVDEIIRHNNKNLNQSGVGRLAIALARESVFGPDVMASGRLSEDGLLFIEQTLRHQFPHVKDDTDFYDNY